MKQTILILAIFTFFSSKGQVQINDSGNHGLMLITTKESDRMKNVEGSPYLNEDFQYGKVMVEGKSPLQVFMRYDVLQENIEIKTDQKGEETYLLPRNEKTVYAIGPDKFSYDQIYFEGQKIFGYFVNLYDGEQFRLLKKPSTRMTEAVKAKTGYDRDRPAEIVIEEEFYIVKANGEVENVQLKHRDIKKAFDSGRAKSFLSDNKIRSEQDLISFISYLDKQ